MTEIVRQWLAKAEGDLKTAKHELALGKTEIVTEAVCFHSQQAVEKYVKAYLISKNEEFGKTHNLEYLLQLCVKHDASFSSCEIGALTDYAVEIRYPDDFYTPSYDEAKNAYGMALNIKNFVITKLGGLHQ